jgi:hypothetical protein
MEKRDALRQLKRNQELIKSEPIKIKVGIFQGYSFSPLLSCTELVPLTHKLNRSKRGYQLYGTKRNINNLLYVHHLNMMGEKSGRVKK